MKATQQVHKERQIAKRTTTALLLKGIKVTEQRQALRKKLRRAANRKLKGV